MNLLEHRCAFNNVAENTVVGQSAAVGPVIGMCGIPENNIPQARINEEDLLNFADFFSWIPGVWRDHLDDKSIFKKEEIPFEGIAGKFDCSG